MCCDRPQDEPALIARAKHGEKAALSLLLERYQRLLWVLAGRICREETQQRNELVQAGSLGLMDAIERYDAKRGTQLSTYAVPWILGEMRRALREAKSGCLSLDAPYRAEGNRLQDRICGIGGIDLEHMALRLALEQLEPQAQWLICLRYYRGYSQAETARLLRRSQAQVSRMERRALDRLKKLLTP